jgi:O-acetyl-ADP-ribose deacetylase (regulator of RNase III)
MSIHIIRADLSQLPFYVDFIVNTANPEPKVGNGLDKYIYEKPDLKCWKYANKLA